jgi:hypothetical protein
MSLRTSGSFKSANHKKFGFANRKSAKCNLCGRSANLIFYLCPPICGFAICGTYLRTANLWLSGSDFSDHQFTVTK